MNNEVTLAQIQAEVKVPKKNKNNFGNYQYRKAEDILEAVKPIVNKYGYWVICTDEIVEIGNRIYVKATALLTNGVIAYSAQAFAREEEIKKGMDASQVTGASSSYARKYALNGLFAIDDTKDADDSENRNEDEIGHEKRDELHRLLESSTYDERQRVGLKQRINGYTSLREYENAKSNLLQNQVSGFDGAINPSQRDIAKKVKQAVNGTN